MYKIDYIKSNYFIELPDFKEERLVNAIRIEDKLERYAAIDEINAETLEHFDEKVFIKLVAVLISIINSLM